MKLALIAISALVTCSFANADTYALLVGIADYPDVVDADGNRIKGEDGNFLDDDLAGPVNDVISIKDLLVNKFGIAPKNIRTTLNGEATEKGFVSGLQWILEKAKPGDRVIFYYSGHGAQVDDASEDDGKEEVICLIDSLVPGDFFSELAKDLAGKGANATFLFDSCYSGGMSRDVFSYNGKTGAAKRKFVGGASVKNKRSLPDVSKQRLRALAKGPKKADGSYLFLMAGQENQPTSDLDFVDAATPDHGLFTLVLSLMLDENPSAPASDIVQEMNTLLEEKGFEQRPTIEASSSERASLPVIN